MKNKESIPLFTLTDGRIFRGMDEWGQGYKMCTCGHDDTEHGANFTALEEAKKTKTSPIYECMKGCEPHRFEQAYAEGFSARSLVPIEPYHKFLEEFRKDHEIRGIKTTGAPKGKIKQLYHADLHEAFKAGWRARDKKDRIMHIIKFKR